jgi:arylsulfatase A-like enzyme/predicted small integral membrane protein
LAGDTGRGFGGRDLLVLAGLLATPCLLRAALIVEETAHFAPADLRGFVADLGVSCGLLALLALLARGSRLLASLLGAAWVLLHFANYETVRELGATASPGDIGFLGDPTFLLGSATAVSRPALLLCLLAATVALAWVGLRGAASKTAWGSALAAAVLLGGHGLWPLNDDVAVWRQANFVQHNLQGLARAGLRDDGPRRRFANPTEAMLDLDPQLAADTGGEPRLSAQGRARNVLLLVLESVSGAHVDGLADAHGRAAVAEMPRLAALARDNLSYTHFFSLQRKTNRGLYALLCGDLPNLAGGLPKMSAYPATGGHPCLPGILRDAGYRTGFVQAAPLGFMLKGQFAPRAGFERVHGREFFDRAYARNVWGVDDRAFFERSADVVAELAAGDAPWFLTLLNVGTHHPYVFPDDFQPEGPSRFLRSLAYLDAALGAFLDRLRAAGVLDDTLVVITSDESMGIPGLFVDPWTKAVTQSWGLLTVLLPEPRAEQVDEPFSQLDVAVSILDYLGLAERAGGLFGRSVFRRHDAPRNLYFANSNLAAAGALDRDGRLLLCLDDFGRCRKLAAPGGRIFGADAEELAWDPATDGVVSEMVQRSVQTIGGDAVRREFELVGAPRVSLDRVGAAEVIHGGQYVDLRAGDWLEVELEVAVGGAGEGARGRLTHILKRDEPPPPYVVKIPLAAGQTLRLRYSFAPDAPVTDIQCHSMGELLAGEALELHFRTARMSVHRGGERPGPGLRVEYLDIEPKP